jgi:hypothetical protein
MLVFVQQGTPQPAQGPQSPAPVRVIGGGQGGSDIVIAGGGANPAQVYEGYRNQRSELANQLDRLEDQRRDISGRLQESELNEVDRKGLEQRLVGVDQRISATEGQLALADANVAKAAAAPGAIVVPPPPPPREGPPDEVYVLSGVFMFVVLFPLTIAYARRIWRRGAQVVTQIPQEIYERFSRLDQSVDAIAIEVERIGEGQRYLTRLYSDQPRVLGAGAAERVEAPVRERERQK